MIINAGYIFFASIGTFFVLAIFLTVENRLRRRVFLSGLRNWLDDVTEKVLSFFGFHIRYLARYILKLSWYYSLHKFLRFSLTFLVKTYDWLESIFINNKNRARVIKQEKKRLKQRNVFGAVAEHKRETSFSEVDKKKFLKEKLEHG